MSRRREIANRLDALSDIGGIMSAMKGLALMEIRILADLIVSQHRMVAGIEAAAADLLAWHPELSSHPVAGRELCILVGSEQGFCGDFNEALLAQMDPHCREPNAPVRWALVGSRLGSRIGERHCVERALPGAIVADDVPRVLLRLTKELNRVLGRDELAGHGLSVLYYCEATGDIRMRRLLPLRDLPPAETHSFPPELNLPPADFLQQLVGHYLHAVLNEVLYSSLMMENRQRQTHTDRALQRLDEDTARLRLKYNTQRQEEITEEIELILLSGDMLTEAHRSR